jgi:hypothetical protein
VFSWIFVIHCALPISGAQIAVPIVLAQRKGNQRKCGLQTSMCRALPVVIELANLFCCSDRKRKYVQCLTTANKKNQNNAQHYSPGHYLTIGAILDPP